MESLGYTRVSNGYSLRDSIPWQDLKADSQEQKDKLIFEKKRSTVVQELYEDLPEEFKKYCTHVHSLRSDETPNHAYLRRLFSNLFRHKGYTKLG
jgi:casein kinase 1